MRHFFTQLRNLRDGPLSYEKGKAPFYAGVRLTLGLAQMFMAVFSMVLLFETGWNKFSLSAAAFTTVLTVLSRILFRGTG